MSITIQSKAADMKAGMTLDQIAVDEIATFVQEAMRAGIDGGEPVRVRTGYASQIRELQVPK